MHKSLLYLIVLQVISACNGFLILSSDSRFFIFIFQFCLIAIQSQIVAYIGLDPKKKFHIQVLQEPMYRSTIPVQTFVISWCVYIYLNNKHVALFISFSLVSSGCFYLNNILEECSEVEFRTLLQKAFILTVKTYLCWWI